MMSMKRKLHVFHIEKPQAISLQLHYKSRDLSLFILLPEDVSGLDQVRGRLCDGKMVPVLTPVSYGLPIL